MSKDLGNNSDWHPSVKLPRCEPMPEHVQMAARNLQRFAKVFLQHKVNVPLCSVLRGKNEAFPSAADVFAEGIHSLGRNRNTSDCVHRLRSLTPAASQGLMSAIEFFERVDVTQGTYR